MGKEQCWEMELWFDKVVLGRRASCTGDFAP